MAGLSVLGAPDSPVNRVTQGPLQAANPVSRVMSPVQQATDTLYSDAAVLNPADMFAQAYLANVPSAAEMAQLKANMYQAQQTQQQTRQNQLATAAEQWSPEQESMLNWQALGQMGANMMANPYEPWGAGTKAYMDQRGQNMAALNAAKTHAADLQAAYGEKDYANAVEQYKLGDEAGREGLKAAGDLLEKQMGRQQQNRQFVKDATGAVWLMDKSDPQAQPQKVLGSSGLTPEQTTQLGEYFRHLRDNIPDGPNKEAKIASMYEAKANEYRTMNSPILEQAAMSELPGAPKPVRTEISPGGTKEEALAMAELAWEEANKPGQPQQPGATSQAPGADFGPFSPEQLSGYSPPQTENPSKQDAEAWKLRLERNSKQAQAELDTATTNLQQSDAMLESSKAALATQAPTGLLQSYKNWFGSLLGFAGVQGPIVDEAMKGTTFETLVNGAVQVLQNAATGVQTEGDAQRFRQSLVTIKNSAEANQYILKYMESMQAKRQLEVEYRYLYSANNVDPAGAGYKWSRISKDIPLIQNTPRGPVFFSQFMSDYMATVKGATKAQALQDWQKLKAK